MASEADRSPRARHRFGFSGKRKRPVSSTTDLKSVEVSSDDILDSLTKQAASQIGSGESQTRTLELLEVEPTLSNNSGILTQNEFIVPKGKGYGHYAIVLMGIAGMVAVWFFSFGKTLINSAFLNNLIQRTNVKSVFANPAEIAIVSTISLTIASFIAIRRRSRRLQLSP